MQSHRGANSTPSTASKPTIKGNSFYRKFLELNFAAPDDYQFWEMLNKIIQEEPSIGSDPNSWRLLLSKNDLRWREPQKINQW
jgi:hypothetical protein